MEEYLAAYTAKEDPVTPAQPTVQTASALPARAAGGHAQQAPAAAAAPPTSSRVVAKSTNNSSAKTPGSSANKRVIYIVAGDDGSHVPILRKVQVYGEEASKGYEKTPAPACNVVKQARLDAGKQPVRRPRIQLLSHNREERSAELMDDDEEAAIALSVKLERNASYVDRSLQLVTAEEHDVMEIDDISSDDTGSQSDSDSSSGSESEKEEGRFFYPAPEALGTVKAPQVGMKFPTLEDAHEYYNTYALQTGFVVVRGRNYKRQRFQLDCNRNRKVKLVEDLNLKRKRKKNVIEKTNCQAKIIVKLIKGEWVIAAVQNEHNHPLSPSRSFTRFLTSQKHMSPEERSFSRVLQQSRVPPGEILKILRRMSGFFRELPSKEKQALILQSAEQWRKANLDVEKTLNHFEQLQLQDPCFFYTVQKDEDGTLRSIFWTDARSRMDYEIFGDFVSFDTTFSTNRHNMPFVPITGMNSRGRTIVLGCALLQDRKAETYKWMLETFLQEMGGGQIPRSVITSQDEAMAKAIAEVMPQARHRFCRWNGKAQEKMAAFVAARGNMKAELDILVDSSLTETEFEQGWSALIQRHDASENEYLQLLWEMRKTWAPVYFMQDFFPFVVSARGSQGAFSLFKENVLPKDKIENLIEKYEEMQDKIKKTDEEDVLEAATEPSCFSLQPIERHASRVYTRQIFLKVQKELLHSTAFKVQEIERGTLYRLDKAYSYENPEYDRDSFEVSIEPGLTDTYTCQCAKFARDGILCCHVFRLFTQFGIDEIPEKYIVARWTDGFREEQLERREEGRLVVAAQREEDAARYAALMSKAAGIGREICGDGAKCDAFMLELDRIREKMATMAMANDHV
ncbi:hypothetical protein VPH35_107109 [Triticum aestivum]|uniref:protein FAR1-RELATED SEQUENCE 5 n=1 Tax=Triticum aestivum TaxID=4565 RepID=UPI0003D451E6|nr:protein FAR1-RELATED SEQUENCE 5-like [Triticum aestivum]